MLCDQSIAVVGATGVVGREALSILASRGVPAERIIALAGERSAGRRLEYGGGEVVVGSAGPDQLGDADIVLLCADSETSRRLAPAAAERGAWVIDNSSAFRLDADVPLIVPEINGSLLDDAARRPRIIANPNCSTIILLLALEPLRRAFGVEAIDVATYQAVSGAGQAGIDELHAQVRASSAGLPAAPAHFPEPCAFNVFSHDSAVEEATGVNGEERKIIGESRKIWGNPRLRVTPTCVRVPVVRAHTQAISVTLATPASERQVREALVGGVGLTLVDDRARNSFPTPLKASGRDDVLIGRIRPDPSSDRSSEAGAHVSHDRWCLLACGDQLRKGAALNAVQIAERVARGAAPALARRSDTVGAAT